MLAPPRPPERSPEPPTPEARELGLPEALTLTTGLCAGLRFTPEQFEGLCQANPEAVLELASPSDGGPRGLTALRRKMAAYQRNGARLGWLLIPQERAVEVWGPLVDPTPEPRRIEAATGLDGAPAFPGLVIDLAEIWAG